MNKFHIISAVFRHARFDFGAEFFDEAMMFRTLARFFLGITILFIICAVALKHGIAVSHLDVGFAKLEGFYLKLDENLILRIKNLEVTQNNTQNLEQNSTDLRTQSEKILEFSKKISLINSFFEEIDVQNLKIKGESLRLKYKSDVFYADTRFFALSSRIAPGAVVIKDVYDNEAYS